MAVKIPVEETKVEVIEITSIEQAKEIIAAKDEQIAELNKLSSEEDEVFLEKNKQIVELEEQIKAMQAETISYKEEMEAKMQSISEKIAPEKTIISFDGKDYEIKGKLLLIPGKGKHTPASIKADPELVNLVVTKFPGMLKEI